MIGSGVWNGGWWEEVGENGYVMGEMVDGDRGYIRRGGVGRLGVGLGEDDERSVKVGEWVGEDGEVGGVKEGGVGGSKGEELWKGEFRGRRGVFWFVVKKKVSNEEVGKYVDKLSLLRMG